MYKLDVGTYPTSEEGLDALLHRPPGVDNWNGPYLKGNDAPKDPWNHAYAYEQPSSREGHDYDLCSAGPLGYGSAVSGQPGAICNP